MEVQHVRPKKNPPKITTYNRGTVSERHILKEQKKNAVKDSHCLCKHAHADFILYQHLLPTMS